MRPGKIVGQLIPRSDQVFAALFEHAVVAAKRFCRLTLALSMKLRNLEAAAAMHMANYNFCWLANGNFKGEKRRLPPAMQAGIVNSTDGQRLHYRHMQRLKQRWKFQRTNGWLHRYGRLAIRTDHRADLFLGWTQLACLITIVFRGFDEGSLANIDERDTLAAVVGGVDTPGWDDRRPIEMSSTKFNMPAQSIASVSRKLSEPSMNFWQSALWSREAPAALKSAAQRSDAAAFASAWRELVLSGRSAASRVPAGLCRWSWFPVDNANPIGRMVSELFPTSGATDQKPHRGTMKAGKHDEDRIENLVVALAGKPVRWTAAEAVTAGELLLTNAATMDAELFVELWSRFADEVRAIDPDADHETPDQQLVRSGELRLLAGWLLQPSPEAQKLAQLGRKTLIAELHKRTDTDGTPHAELAARMPLWLAPLIRATLWAESLERPLWSDADRSRLALILERAIPLCRPDGRLAMTNGLAFPAIPLLSVAAKSISLGPHARKLLESLQNAPPAKPLRKRAAKVAFMPSSQSDWARFAVLRSDWSAHADSLAISHHQPFPQLDVAAGGAPILHGEWKWELQIGDAAIEPAGEWAASSWFSDPDADYLELQMAGPGNLHVERQVLLSRKEQFLLLADVVRGARSVAKDAAPIHLRSRLPLAEGIVVEPSLPTRELKLKARKQTVRIFPLALPMERVHSTPHSCVVERNELVAHHVGFGNGLYAPLILDWHPARTKQPAIWRTLTVTEAANVLSRDLAGAHRLQLGKFQLLIYRSLSKIKAPRAVLGHHTWQESVIGYFDNGEVDSIVHVDE